MTNHRLSVFFLIVVILILSVRPAHAALEQVNPITTVSYAAYTPLGNDSGIRNSDFRAACESYAATLPSGGGVRVSGTAVQTANFLTTGGVTYSSYVCYLVYISSGGSYSTSSSRPISLSNQCPVASPPYTYNPTSAKCERQSPCTAGTTWGSPNSVFDIGTQEGLLPSSACVNSCNYTNSISVLSFQRQLVNSVYHYYNVGTYTADGTSCTDPAPSLSTVAAVPNPTCSEGQKLVIGANNFAKCYTDLGFAVNPNSASAVAASNTLAAADAAAAAVLAASAVAAAGGDSSAQAAAAAAAAGASAADSQAKQTDPFCVSNPSDPSCSNKETDFGSTTDETVGTKNINVAVNPVSFGSAGVCPAPSSMTIAHKTYFFKWDLYCDFASGVRPIILAFSWLAAAYIVVGGLRSS